MKQSYSKPRTFIFSFSQFMISPFVLNFCLLFSVQAVKKLKVNFFLKRSNLPLWGVQSWTNKSFILILCDFYMILMYQLIAEYNNMLKIFQHFFILGLLVLLGTCQIQIDLNSTNATLYANKNLILNFKVFGGIAPYFIKYTSIPRDWRLVKNDLAIPDFSQIIKSGWTFDISVKDSSNSSSNQTVRLTVDNDQIIIYPVTVLEPVATFSNKNALDLPTFVNDIINRYPGKKGFGFDIDYASNSVITPKLIQTAQARYIPERDSRPQTKNQLELQRANLKMKQSIRNTANFVELSLRISKRIQQSQSLIPISQNQIKQLKKNSTNCQLQQFGLQDVQAKISNAINDRDIKIKQQLQLLDSDTQALFDLKQNIIRLTLNKTMIEKFVAPESSVVGKNQQDIRKCQSRVKEIDAEIQNLGNDKKNNQIQIQLTTESVNNSDNRLRKIDSSLILVRQNIEDLQRQLKQAKDQQKSLLNDKKTFQAAPIEGKIKIEKLKQKNNQIEQKIRQLSDKTIEQSKICQTVKNNISASKITKLQKEVNYKNIKNQIEQSRNKTQQLQKSLKNHNTTIENLKLENFKLRQQFSENTQRLFQLNYTCKVALQMQRKKQGQLEQIRNSIINDTNAFNQVTIKLQKSRSDEQLAKIMYQQITNRMSSTLFSIVPNNGQISGNPPGNNQRGIALGAPFRFNQVVKGKKTYQLNTLLSTMYEQNLDPTQFLKALNSQSVGKKFDLNITKVNSQDQITIFPVKQQQRIKLIQNNDLSMLVSFNCDNKDQVSHSGIIQEMILSSGTLLVRGDQDILYLLSISPCTVIGMTNDEGFAFKAGSPIYFQGVQASSNGGPVMFSAYVIIILPINK